MNLNQFTLLDKNKSGTPMNGKNKKHSVYTVGNPSYSPLNRKKERMTTVPNTIKIA